MSRTTPEYNIADLIEACEKRSGVFVWKGALDTAATEFNLPTKRSLLDFIATGGLEDRYHIGTKPLELPGPNQGRSVDAYGFFSGLTMHGYLAFFFAAAGMWHIKSFKRNNQSDPRNRPFLLAFQNRKLIDGK